MVLDLLLDPGAVDSYNLTFRPFGLEFFLTDGASEGVTTFGPSKAELLPLIVGEQEIGFLGVEAGEPIVPAAQARAFIELVHRSIQKEAELKYELQNTLEELIAKYEELTVLYESAETVATVMNLEEVSSRILDQAAEILDVHQASLMLLDEKEAYLEVVAARGLREDTVGKVRVKVGTGISGRVASTGKPLLIEDLSAHPEIRRSLRSNEEWSSLLSVPLKVRDRVLGVLNVNNKTNREPFSSGDQKLLMALAQLAAISIQNARTYQNAITDRLTSLYNYGYFREQLDRLLEECEAAQDTLCLLMFDIDHFKNFNDVNGHELGNVALVGVASLCLENSRQAGDRVPDLVARYGGEEFMVLLRGVTLKRAEEVAERIRIAVESKSFPGGENQPTGRVTISIGVASYPQHAKNGDELINAADEALYEAKRGGRNRVEIAT